MWAQGGSPITQVRRTVLLAENRDRVFAAASDFLLQWAKNRPTAADFMLKSAHFVFWTRCAASSRNRLLFCPLYWWPGLQMGTADRAAAKKTDTPGLRPVSYGEPRRQLNSHNGKEYLSFPGKYATKQAPSVPREDRRGQKWAQEPIPADWHEFENCISALKKKG